MIRLEYRGKFPDKCVYATSKSAGFDIVAETDFIIDPGTGYLASTGLYVHSEGCSGSLDELQIRSRSSLAKQGVIVINSPGTIDEDYPDEVRVILYNLGERPHFVAAGDRIAQGVVSYIPDHNVGIPRLDVKRTGGFGSTGR